MDEGQQADSKRFTKRNLSTRWKRTPTGGSSLSTSFARGLGPKSMATKEEHVQNRNGRCMAEEKREPNHKMWQKGRDPQTTTGPWFCMMNE